MDKLRVIQHTGLLPWSYNEGIMHAVNTNLHKNEVKIGKQSNSVRKEKKRKEKKMKQHILLFLS